MNAGTVNDLSVGRIPWESDEGRLPLSWGIESFCGCFLVNSAGKSRLINLSSTSLRNPSWLGVSLGSGEETRLLADSHLCSHNCSQCVKMTLSSKC